jgi:hypothetical protein
VAASVTVAGASSVSVTLASTALRAGAFRVFVDGADARGARLQTWAAVAPLALVAPLSGLYLSGNAGVALGAPVAPSELGADGGLARRAFEWVEEFAAGTGVVVAATGFAASVLVASVLVASALVASGLVASGLAASVLAATGFFTSVLAVSVVVADALCTMDDFGAIFWSAGCDATEPWAKAGAAPPNTRAVSRIFEVMDIGRSPWGRHRCR